MQNPPEFPEPPEDCIDGEQYYVIFTCNEGSGILSYQAVGQNERTAAPMKPKPKPVVLKSPCSCEEKLAEAFRAGYRLGRSKSGA